MNGCIFALFKINILYLHRIRLTSQCSLCKSRTHIYIYLYAALAQTAWQGAACAKTVTNKTHNTNLISAMMESGFSSVWSSVIQRKHYFHVSVHKIVCLVDWPKLPVCNQFSKRCFDSGTFLVCILAIRNPFSLHIHCFHVEDKQNHGGLTYQRSQLCLHTDGADIWQPRPCSQTHH